MSGWGAHLDQLVLFVASCVAVARYLQMHAWLGPSAAPHLDLFQGSPRAPQPGYGWWSWWDQSNYIEATLAWAQGILDPSYHWYLPGYPLLGAPFVRLTPAQPFVVPDLACLIASLWLFAFLAARLMVDLRHARAIGAAVFVATTVLPETSLWSWVVPWTTTPETVCLFACLLAAARFTEALRPLDAFFAALAGVATAGFRPADSAVIVLVSGAVMTWALVRQWPGWRRALHVAVAALAGAALPVFVFGGAYLATVGWRPSGYVTESNALGFEWRLLPLRWVTIMIDPQPLFPEGRGLAATFPWIAPGIAGMAASLVAPRGVSRRVHLLVIGATLLDCAMFLTYRDLHQTALWRLGNYHYFKWMLPVFGLYALLLLRAVAQAPRAPALAATACTVPALFMWRAELTNPVPLPRASDAQTLTLPSGLSPINDVVLAKGHGDWAALYGEGSRIDASSMTFRSFYDFKIFSWPDRFMLLPLRPMPSVASTLHLVRSAALDPAVAPVLARQTLVWGLPCWVLARRPGCRPRLLLAPPTLPLGETVTFASAGKSDRYLISGWSDAESEGRWTEGHEAAIEFNLPRLRPDEVPVIEITAHGFVPNHAAPTRVAVTANNEPIARWRFGPADPITVRALIPADVAAPDGAVTLDMLIANPRRPSEHGFAPDARELGIYVEAIKLTTVPRP